MGKDKLEQEFIERVKHSQGVIHKVCNIYAMDEEHRKDLFQEILIQLWKSYPSFKGQAKFSTWMYKVSLNVAIQYLRKQKKKPNEVELSSNFNNLPDQIKEEENDEKKQLLHQAIHQLNKIEKAIIMLYLEEKGYDEIAEIIGISQNYVRVKMARIRQKLKKRLKESQNGIG